MIGVHGHSVRFRAKDSRFVHIVPEAVHIVATYEDIVREEITPELLSVAVQDINPG